MANLDAFGLAPEHPDSPYLVTDSEVVVALTWQMEVIRRLQAGEPVGDFTDDLEMIRAFLQHHRDADRAFERVEAALAGEPTEAILDELTRRLDGRGQE